MKKMKFLLKCILATLPATVLIGYTLLCPMCYMDEEYPAWDFTKSVTKGCEYGDRSFDIVVLGDSGAMSSIVPGRVDESCINLAVGGATSIEMFYFMEDYLKTHDAPKTAVIMFAPFHYWHIDNFATRTRYFKAIDAGKLFELYDNARALKADSVTDDDYAVKELSARLGLPNVYLPALTASRFTGRYDKNTALSDEIRMSFGYGPFGELPECYDESYETSYEDMEDTGDARLITLYMRKLLKLCTDRGIKVRLIQPAVNEATYEGMSEKYLASYKEHMEGFAEEFPDIECESSVRVYDGKYFSDTSHLNPSGALAFTQETMLCK